MIRRYTHRPAAVLLPTLLVAGTVLADWSSRQELKKPAGVPQPVAGQLLSQMPMTLEPNQGQAPADVQFTARGHNYVMTLRPDEARISTWKRVAKHTTSTNTAGRPEADLVEANIRMRVVGGNPNAKFEAEGEPVSRVNYLKGKDVSKYRTDIPVYEKVRYNEVYPGIDLVYYGNQEHYEYDFVVDPGVSPGDITLQFDGAKGLRVDSNGDLLASVDGADLRYGRPVIYQEVHGQRQEVSGSYALLENNQVGFNIDGYDPNRELVIDPPVLGFSGFLGHLSLDQAHDVQIDADGYVYVLGVTRSTAFPVTTPIPASGEPIYSGGPGYQAGIDQTYNGGDWDLFLTKIAPPGLPTAGETRARVVYSTFIGGSASEARKSIPGAALELDSSGRIYILGETYSADYPSSSGSGTLSGDFTSLYPNRLNTNGTPDLGFTVLNSSGTAVVYSTYWGGKQEENAGGLALDGNGRVIIGGRTFSSPTTDAFPLLHAIDTTMENNQEGFVTGLQMNFGSPTTATHLFTTYLGGNNIEGVGDVAVRFNGGLLDVYACGNTYSTANFPTNRSLQSKFADNSADAFITKLRYNTGTPGLTNQWSTLFGGFAEEQGYGIAVDSTGDCYVTGLLASTPLAVQANPRGAGTPSNTVGTTGITQTSYGNGDVYVLRLGDPLAAGDPNTDPNSRVQMEYYTVYGSIRHDNGHHLVLDPVTPGVVWITGYTTSMTSDTPPFPIANSLYDTKLTQDEAVFVAKLNTTVAGNSTLMVSGLINGSSQEQGNAIAVRGTDNCPVIVGYTEGGSFPTIAGPQLNHGGQSTPNQDGFVSKFCPDDATGLQIYKVDVTLVSATTAVVTYQTNRPANTIVRYGTSPGVYTRVTQPSGALVSDTNGNVFQHRVTIGDSLGTTTDGIGNPSTDGPLTPGTLYYVQVESTTPAPVQTAQSTAPAFLTAPLFPKFTITSTTFRTNSNPTNFLSHIIIKNTGGASASSVQFTQVRFRGTGGKSNVYTDPNFVWSSGTFFTKTLGIPQGSGAHPGTLAVGQTGRIQYQYSNTASTPPGNGHAWNAGQSALIDIQGTYSYPGGGTASFAATHRIRMPANNTTPTRRPSNGRTR